MAVTRRSPAPPLTRHYRRTFVVRGVVLWIGVHVASAIGGGLVLHPVASAALVLIVGFGTFLDQRVRREDLLLANCGVSSLRGPALACVTAATLEIPFQIGLRALGHGG